MSPAALETHGFPRTVPINKGYDLERSSGSLGTGSGEGQSCGRSRAREPKLVGEQARGQSSEGAAGACNHDAGWVLEGTVRSLASLRSYPWFGSS